LELVKRFIRSSRQKKALILMLLMLVLSLVVWGCSPGASGENKTTITRLLMDTKVDLTLYEVEKKNSEKISGDVFTEMERLENILSRTITSSDLARLNKAAGKQWVKVSPELFFVLKKALEFAEVSEGAFDPTVAPLLDLWGFGTDYQRVPSEEEISRVLPLVDYRLVELDESRSMVYLPLEGMKLDLGGIAKGYIVDQGLEITRKFDIKASLINAGGDIRMYGEKPSGEKWSIAVQDPKIDKQNSAGPYVALLYLEGEGSVVTSGDYERYFEEDGEIYHHILNPADGKPARTVSSVTIIAEDALTADAFSTAVFVMGREKGLELLESLPGIEGVIVDKEGKIYYTSGLEDKIEIITQESEEKSQKTE